MNVERITLNRAIAGLMAVFFSFTFAASHAMGLPASVKYGACQIAAKNPSSPTGPGSELPYESNEKEFEDRLEESKGNLYVIYITGPLLSLHFTDLRLDSGRLCHSLSYSGSRIPAYLLTHTLLI